MNVQTALSTPYVDNSIPIGTSSKRWTDIRAVTGTISSGFNVLAGTTAIQALTCTTAQLTGALTYGGVTFANTTTGSGSLVGSISPTFTGTATFSTITATSIAGTLTTAAQANITSLGTLSALNVSGLATVAQLQAGLKTNLVERTNDNVANNGTIDFPDIDPNGGSYNGILMISTTLLANAGVRTTRLYFFSGRGNLTLVQLGNVDGTTGACAFTITNPSTGILRFTNTQGGAVGVRMNMLSLDGSF